MLSMLPNNPTLAAYYLHSLAATAKLAGSMAASTLTSGGGIDAVTAAMTTHQSEPRVHEAACALAAELARASDAAGRERADRATRAKLPKCACFSISQFTHDVETTLRALDALGAIASGFDENAETRRAKTMDDGGSSALVKAMKAHPSDVRIQRLGASLLGTLADGTVDGGALADARATLLVATGALDALILAFRAHASDSLVCEHSARALCTLTAPSHGADARAGAAELGGAIEALAAMLAVHGLPTSPSASLEGASPLRLATWAACALRNLVSSAEQGGVARRQAAIDCGAAVALSAAMRAHARHGPLLSAGSTALGLLADGADRSAVWRREALIEAVPALVHALTVSVETEVSEAAHTEGHTHADAASRARAAAAAHWPHAAQWRVAEQAAIALGTLAAGDDTLALARKAKIHGAGAIPSLVVAMRAHSARAKTQEACCDALRLVCGGVGDKAGTERQAAAVQAGALAALVVALHEHKQRAGVVRAACGAISSVGFGAESVGGGGGAGAVGGTAGAASPSFAQLALDAGALPLLLSSMAAFPANLDVQTAACRAIRCLAEGGTEKARVVKVALAERGACYAIVAAVAAHEHAPAAADGALGDGCLLEEALGAIANICQAGPDARALATAAGAHSSVRRARAAHPNARNVQEAAEAAASSLSATTPFLSTSPVVQLVPPTSTHRASARRSACQPPLLSSARASVSGASYRGPLFHPAALNAQQRPSDDSPPRAAASHGQQLAPPAAPPFGTQPPRLSLAPRPTLSEPFAAVSSPARPAQPAGDAQAPRLSLAPRPTLSEPLAVASSPARPAQTAGDTSAPRLSLAPRPTLPAPQQQAQSPRVQLATVSPRSQPAGQARAAAEGAEGSSFAYASVASSTDASEASTLLAAATPFAGQGTTAAGSAMVEEQEEPHKAGASTEAQSLSAERGWTLDARLGSSLGRSSEHDAADAFAC